MKGRLLYLDGPPDRIGAQQLGATGPPSCSKWTLALPARLAWVGGTAACAGCRT